MKLILKEDIDKLGFKDEVVNVKNGFGRNYLIPKGKAILATESQIKILEERLRQQSVKEEKIIEKANKLAKAISEMKIEIKAKVAEGGQKLFGSVNVTQFTDTLEELGHVIDKRFIKIGTIKELGSYEAEIRLHRNVTVSVPFNIIPE